MTIPIKRIRSLAERLCLENGIAPHGACLLHAIAANKLLNAPIMAGSLSWKYTNFDNGSNPTHFSYMFIPSEAIQHTSQRRFPEMHVWNIYQGKILDLTTCFLPTQAKILAQMDWEPELLPPDHFHGENCPNKNHFYSEHYFATYLANEYARQIVAQK